MAAKTLSKEQFQTFTDNLIAAGRVVGVKRKENKFAFGDLTSASELTLDYDVTLRSPRVFFQPPTEELISFTTGDTTTAAATIPATEPFVLLGVHTYDLIALNQMDRIWNEDNADQNYEARRKAATVIALEPIKASKWSFWASMGATKVEKGFDLLLTDIGGKYVIEIGTEAGKKLISAHAADAKEASADDLAARDRVRKELPSYCKADRKVNASVEELPTLIKSNYENPIWEKNAEKCYSCGACNLVCPTCYCFDVHDDIELDLKHGTRTRTWDGCLLEAFAHVGSGENFREHRGDRFRHRIFRKTVYMPEKINELACVGCGRCSEVCLPDITDPVKIINTIKEGN